MLLGYHFIFSAYGFWLPNDPRGSWSEVVREYEIARFGPSTKINTTRSVAAQSHHHAKRLAAKQALRYPPVRFASIQAAEIAKGFETACGEADYRLMALAILPDHCHLLLQRHERPIDQIASHMKAKATQTLSAAGVHPLANFASPKGRVPSPWARNYWSVFVTHEDQMHLATQYVNDNPVKAGLAAQHWSFVKPYTR